MKVDASIRPKSVELDPVPAPTVSIATPSLDPLNIPDMDPPSLNVPEPATPDFALDLPEPNTKPFADFLFDRGMVNSYGKTAHIDPDGYGAWKKFETSKHNIGSGDNKPSYVGEDTRPNYNDGDNHQFWSGFKPDANDNEGKNGTLVNESGIDQNTRGWRYSEGTLYRNVPRSLAVLYFNNSAVNNYVENGVKKNGFQVKNFRVYAAGNVGGIGKTNWNKDGVIGIHTVWDGTLNNIHGYLYGRAVFLSMETWHAGKLEFENTTADIVNLGNANAVPNENTIFYIYPATYETITTHNYWSGSSKQRGAFKGTVDANIISNKNSVYSTYGAQGSFDIDSKGTYKLEGSGNLVYSGLGYTPNYQNLIGEGTSDVSGDDGRIVDRTLEGMTPSIKLTKAPESYGDENVILLFNNRITLDPVNTYDAPRQMIGQNNHGWRPGGSSSTIGNPATRKANWQKSGVGIYQGEIRANAIIGNKLAIDNNATE